MLKRFFVAATMAISLLAANLSMAASPNVQALIDGNLRFISGNLTSLPANSGVVSREEVALAQHPFAIVLDCSDSRLSPEIIFDQGLGKLFPIRVAGNVLDKHQVASIQYAIEHLHAKTVVIMGHERCGAVGAAMSVIDGAGAPIQPEYDALTPELQYLVSTPSLKDSVVETKTTGNNSATECALLNVDKVYAELMLDPLMTDPLLGVEVVKAFYDLDDGVVTFNTTATSYFNVKSSSTDVLTGTISPSGDSAVLPYGSQPFVITPVKGYALSQLLVNGTPVTLPSGSSYVLSGVSADKTVVASFSSTAPVAGAVEWVGAQTSGVDGAIKVWWPLSSAPAAVYNVFKDGVLLQANVAGTSFITPNQANGTYVFSVQAVAAGFQPSAQKSAAAVTINKTAIAPAYLGAQKSSSGIKLWWPSVATPGASYVITENGSPTIYTLQASGGTLFTILPAKAPGSGVYSYTIQTTATGYTNSSATGGASVSY